MQPSTLPVNCLKNGENVPLSKVVGALKLGKCKINIYIYIYKGHELNRVGY